MSDHLKFDTDFLDKDTPQKTGTINREKPLSEKSKYNWKKILIIASVILFFGWIIWSDSGSSTSTNTSSGGTNSNNLLSEGGQTFRCSDSNYNRAMQLKPNASTEAQLATESDTLDRQIAANKAEKVAIEAMYVDENNEYAVDNYNSRVDRYNTERQRLITVANSWDQRRKAFDSQIDTYNNFLDANCTPQ
ncbi:MAG: hypothetical protein FJY91_02335 [Candidatus Harrisonbacteria bacterium]|nr:hypothetical protein [Candidatus Harrisonbacteria bacterium]